MDQLMTPTHGRWDEFADRLSGPDGCDFKQPPGKTPASTTWKCDHTHVHTRAILKEMGLSEGEIDDSVAYFEERGGYCDCEVLFNVDR